MTKLSIDFPIHDSEIICVKEDTLSNIIDFEINYPIDWNSNTFEKKTLRFHNCLNYMIKEIPFASRPHILDLKDYGEINYSIGEGRNKIDVKRRMIELITNAGSRILEFERLELIDENE
jgi:hypothetical protein